MADATPRRILVTWDLETWEEIAAALGVSVRTARRWAALATDPLPVTEHGRARARSAQIQAWLDRRFRGRRPTDDDDPDPI